MTPKDLVVFLGPQPAPARLAFAAGLARRWQAHLIAVFVAGPPDLGEYAGFVSAEVLRGLAGAAQVAMQEAAQRAREHFESVTAQRSFSAEWRLVEDDDDEVLMLHARHASLAILGPPARQASRPERMDRAQRIVLGAGRPCILWPDAWPGEGAAARRIVVGWNGSREATRSIAASMPLLVQADVVYLAVAPQARLRGRYGEDPGADMATHLARHGVPVVLDRLDGEDAGQALLQRCGMLDADLLVVGAKAQVRIADLLLGDATRTLFNHARLPLLLTS